MSVAFRPQTAGFRDEDGSAAVEFLSLGVLLLVPLVYLVLTLSAVQGAAFAASGAAREAARVLALSPSDATGRARAAAAVRLTLADWRIAPGAAHVELTCTPQPTDCITPSGRVTAVVEVSVALPFLPAAVRTGEPGTVRLTSSALEPVSRFAVTSP